MGSYRQGLPIVTRQDPVRARLRLEVESRAWALVRHQVVTWSAPKARRRGIGDDLCFNSNGIWFNRLSTQTVHSPSKSSSLMLEKSSNVWASSSRDSVISSASSW